MVSAAKDAMTLVKERANHRNSVLRVSPDRLRNRARLPTRHPRSRNRSLALSRKENTVKAVAVAGAAAAAGIVESAQSKARSASHVHLEVIGPNAGPPPQRRTRRRSK
jgi:hypothetical protein